MIKKKSGKKKSKAKSKEKSSAGGKGKDWEELQRAGLDAWAGDWEVRDPLPVTPVWQTGFA